MLFFWAAALFVLRAPGRLPTGQEQATLRYRVSTHAGEGLTGRWLAPKRNQPLGWESASSNGVRLRESSAKVFELDVLLELTLLAGIDLRPDLLVEDLSEEVSMTTRNVI